jgi:hypothetical protein
MTSALSRSTENMALRKQGLEDVWLVLGRVLLAVLTSASQRDERSSDGFFLFLLVFCHVFCIVFAHAIKFSCSNQIVIF